MNNKTIFTFLSICNGMDTMYFEASKSLTNEILSHTPHDVLITNNDISQFDEFENNDRVMVRGLPKYHLTHYYSTSFNYNLKYLCYIDIPTEYDHIIYLDGDIKLSGWGPNSDEFIQNFLLIMWMLGQLELTLF